MKNFSSLPLFSQIFFSLIPTTLLLLICYYWADPTFALWINHQKLRSFPVFAWGTHCVDIITIGSVLYYAYFSYSFSSYKKEKEIRYSYPLQTRFPFLNIANSVAIAIFIKDVLKTVFGRYWPTTWIQNNPSLIHDHAYGFHWFHQGAIYRSFPSGHTTVAAAFMMSLWLAFPHSWWRWLGVYVLITVVLGLLINNYHFIGDCIAGAWIGCVVAIYVNTLSYHLKSKSINNSEAF